MMSVADDESRDPRRKKSINYRLCNMSNSIRISLLGALFCGAFYWSAGAQGTQSYRDLPPSLERDVLQYMDGAESLRQRIQDREEGEIKPILSRLVEEPILDPARNFGELTLLSYLAAGLEDKEFALSILRKIALKYKEFPFDMTPLYLSDYLKRDPEGAEATFRELAETGNENIKKYAEEYLAKIAEKRAPNGAGIPAHSNSKPAEENPLPEPEGDERSKNSPWFLFALGGVAALGIALILLRSRLRR